MHKANNNLTSYEYEEPCAECGEYIKIDVDYACPHLETVCPVCGARLMLCAICKTFENGSCDWGEGRGCSMDKRHKELNKRLCW